MAEGRGGGIAGEGRVGNRRRIRWKARRGGGWANLVIRPDLAELAGRRAGRMGNSGGLGGRGEGQRADFTRAEVGFDNYAFPAFPFP